MSYYLSALNLYFDCRSRASRREYWSFILVHILVVLFCVFVDAGIAAAFALEAIPWVTVAYGLATLVPAFTVSIRRLHDSGLSWAWILVSFVPLIGSVVIIFLMLKPGDRGPNKYGVARERVMRSGLGS